MLLPDRLHHAYPCRDHDVIATTPSGLIRRCSNCGALQLRFGNFALGLTPDDVGTFRRALADSQRRAARRLGRNILGRAIEFTLADSGIILCFSLAEARELDSLLAAISGDLDAAN